MRYLACVLLFFAVATRTYADETNEAHTEKIPLSQAVTLGVIQGITEFLPVSSTGHMIIANECFFHASQQSKSLQAALNNYMVCINLGTLLVLLLFFRNDVRRILNGLCGKDTKGFKLAFNLGIAFVPAGILGLLTDKTLERFYTPTCVATGLMLGSIGIRPLQFIRRESSVYRAVANRRAVAGVQPSSFNRHRRHLGRADADAGTAVQLFTGITHDRTRHRLQIPEARRCLTAGNGRKHRHHRYRGRVYRRHGGNLASVPIFKKQRTAYLRMVPPRFGSAYFLPVKNKIDIHIEKPVLRQWRCLKVRCLVPLFCFFVIFAYDKEKNLVASRPTVLYGFYYPKSPR